ncbi:MAG: rhodanese-like domain-containing protein [Acidobacteriota bacterium]
MRTFGLVVLISALLAHPAISEEASIEVSEISSKELRLVLAEGGWVVVDLRGIGGWLEGQYEESPEVFAAGHIPGAYPMGIEKFSDAEGVPLTNEALLARLQTLGSRASTTVRPRAVTFVLYGGDESDPNPWVAAKQLKAAGLEVVVLLGGWKSWIKSGGARLRLIGAREAAELQRGEDTVVIDLREDWDYASGAIPGASSIPLRLLPQRLEGVLESRAGFDPLRSSLLFYCYGLDCIRSQTASIWAAREGYRELVWLRGGIDAWEAAGFDLWTEPSAEEELGDTP